MNEPFNYVCRVLVSRLYERTIQLCMQSSRIEAIYERTIQLCMQSSRIEAI